MISRRFRHCLLLIAACTVISIAGACSNRMEDVVDDGLVFPPTPTFPVLPAPILLPNAVTHPPPSPTSSATSIPQIAARSDLDLDSENSPMPKASESPELAMITAMPSATSTATPIATATPIPSPTPCSSPGQIVTDYFDSALGGRINYRVYLPPCYSDSGRSYPALYMLPGNIYTDSIWDELGLDEAAEAGINEKRLAPMLIVMVSGGSLANTTSGGVRSYESFMLEEFIPYFEGSYCAYPQGEGRAIGGMSRGGYWALEIAFRHPEEFASAGGHSPALVDFNGGPTINPLNTGLDNELGDLRIYLDIGENDWLLPNAMQLHDQMTTANRAHTWVLNDGIHEEAYWATHAAEYLDWYAEPWLNREKPYPPCQSVPAG